MFLGLYVEVTCPKSLAVNVVLTFWNCVWLKVLKVSARNSRRLPRASLKVKLLNSERFQLCRPGPYTEPRGKLPQAPIAGRENGEGEYHAAKVFGMETEPL